jgi:hypothetical protein
MLSLARASLRSALARGGLADASPPYFFLYFIVVFFVFFCFFIVENLWKTC